MPSAIQRQTVAKALRVRYSGALVASRSDTFLHSVQMTSLSTLFGEVDAPVETIAPSASGPFAEVALTESIDRTLDYAIPQGLVASVQVGQRVRVPLGKANRPRSGYVISIHSTTTFPRIKKVLAIEDQRVLISPPLMELARWLSRYYVAPLGAVIESVLPSAVRKRIGLGYTQIVRLASRASRSRPSWKRPPPRNGGRFSRSPSARPGCAIELVRLASESGATVPTVRKLVRLGLITITPEPDFTGMVDPTAKQSGQEFPESDLALNEDQQKAFDSLGPRVAAGGFSVNLLLGVTGSGKTEVYLRCIREAVSRGKRAIVLVPEIALTPQTVRRFTARFPSVAILHSGLPAGERHRYWQMISSGRASVVVGARSPSSPLFRTWGSSWSMRSTNPATSRIRPRGITRAMWQSNVASSRKCQ